MEGILSSCSTGIVWFALTPPKMAVHATNIKIRSDMRIPPDERKDIEDKSLSHKLGNAIKTAITVSI